MTEIGSVGQSFNVLRKELLPQKNSGRRESAEANFGEVFSRVIGKNIQQAVIQKDQLMRPELTNYAVVSLRVKNKKLPELEAEILEGMLNKVKRLAVEWVEKRKEGNKK
jgi:hypothetical protein